MSHLKHVTKIPGLREHRRTLPGDNGVPRLIAHELNWDELYSVEKGIINSLGWTQDSWTNPDDYPDVEPFKKHWLSLNQSTMGNAYSVGYTYEDYIQGKERTPQRIDEIYKIFKEKKWIENSKDLTILGWTKRTWQNPGTYPDGPGFLPLNDKCGTHLRQYQIQAMKKIGFKEEDFLTSREWYNSPWNISGWIYNPNGGKQKIPTEVRNKHEAMAAERERRRKRDYDELDRRIEKKREDDRRELAMMKAMRDPPAPSSSHKSVADRMPEVQRRRLQEKAVLLANQDIFQYMI